ncbi:hypothetical protein MC885_001230 [Smutsia gigantea]|nr:hypothetical protein MC885_001230 [Smutsia gigantea]
MGRNLSCAAGDLRSSENTSVPARPSDPSAMPASPQTPPPQVLGSWTRGGERGPFLRLYCLPLAAACTAASDGWGTLARGGKSWEACSLRVGKGSVQLAGNCGYQRYAPDRG